MTPILIPAKNIYNKQYQKLIDNIIDLVQVKTVQYSSNITKGSAYTESTKTGFEQIYNYDDDVSFSASNGDIVGGKICSITYAYIQPRLYTSPLLKIPKDYVNKTILSLEDVEFDVICTLKTGTVTLDAIKNPNEFVENISFVQKEEKVVNVTTFPSSITVKEGELDFTATSTAYIREDLLEKKITVTEDNDFFYVTLRFICGVKTISAKRILQLGATESIPTSTQIEGTYEDYVPQQVNFTISGITSVVTFVEKIDSFGNLNSKNPFVIGSDNDLMQNEACVIYGTDDDLTYIYLAEKYEELLDEYKNGKKKLTLLCDINDYYYYDATKPDKKGSIAISRNLTRLTFKEYDEVIPMIKLANGDYVPIAKNEDGTPMVFVVLAIRVFYDGVVWQELTLQQK